jgi:hypothetical protein
MALVRRARVAPPQALMTHEEFVAAYREGKLSVHVDPIVLFVGALVFRYFVRATSRGFILKQSLEDPDFYRQAVAARILTMTRS